MSKPYSKDLRLKVIQTIEEGRTITSASRLFNISRETIYSWIRIKQKTGTIEAKKGYQKGHSHKVLDIEKFRIFVDHNKDKTLKEMAEDWPVRISAVSIHRWIKRLGYSYKKNFLPSQKR